MVVETVGFEVDARVMVHIHRVTWQNPFGGNPFNEYSILRMSLLIEQTESHIP